MKNEKQKKYNRAQKAILGMRLRKVGEEWCELNSKTKTAMYDELFLMSKSNVERLFDGSGSEDTMIEFVEKFDLNIDEASKINFNSIVELLKFRFSDEKYRKSFAALGMMAYFLILIWISNTWWSCLGMIISGDIYLRNAKNIWGIKINVTEKDRKFVKIMHVLAGISTIILLVAGFRFAINIA